MKLVVLNICLHFKTFQGKRSISKITASDIRKYSNMLFVVEKEIALEAYLGEILM